MKDSILINKENGTTEEFVGGKDFIDAVAKASSKEELGRILNVGGVCGFNDEQLEESYRHLALSQDWDTLWDILEDKSFENRSNRLAAYGITTTQAEFELINEVIATASDDALIAEITQTREVESSLEVLHRHGYHVMTADFLLLVRENSEHLYEDALLTPEEFRVFSGNTFYERCKKSVNLIFALSTIAGLALGVTGIAEPAMLIAIAGGVSLIFDNSEALRNSDNL